MVQFKTWRDTYLFLLNYGKFSCLNCKYGGHNLDLDVENSEFAYSHNFCTEHIAMIDFAFQFVCGKWTDKDGNTVEGREDECAFDLPQKVLDVLIDEDKRWTFEEIEELVNEHKETIE